MTPSTMYAFLFTDIAESTRLWEIHPEAMGLPSRVTTSSCVKPSRARVAGWSRPPGMGSTPSSATPRRRWRQPWPGNWPSVTRPGTTTLRSGCAWGCTSVRPSRGPVTSTGRQSIARRGSWRRHTEARSSCHRRRRTRQPAYTLAYVLYHVGFFDLGRRDLTTINERAAELGAVAEAHGYEVWRALAMLLEGMGMVGSGSHDRGLARIEEAIGAYEVLDTPPVFWGYLQATRAVAFGMAGRPTDGLPFIEEAMSASGPDSPDYASATTVKGELLLAAGDAVGAEKCFSLAVATAAGADVAMLDLVAATRLVRVRRDPGMVPDGTEELVRAHASFEEGFDLPQLREAAELLDGR